MKVVLAFDGDRLDIDQTHAAGNRRHKINITKTRTLRKVRRALDESLEHSIARENHHEIQSDGLIRKLSSLS